MPDFSERLIHAADRHNDVAVAGHVDERLTVYKCHELEMTRAARSPSPRTLRLAHHSSPNPTLNNSILRHHSCPVSQFRHSYHSLPCDRDTIAPLRTLPLPTFAFVFVVSSPSTCPYPSVPRPSFRRLRPHSCLLGLGVNALESTL